MGSSPIACIERVPLRIKANCGEGPASSGSCTSVEPRGRLTDLEMLPIVTRKTAGAFRFAVR